jgi:hypothetical protein
MAINVKTMHQTGNDLFVPKSALIPCGNLRQTTGIGAAATASASARSLQFLIAT